MLESFYNTFGFISSLLVSIIIFSLAILWITGLAGMCSDDFQHSKKNLIIAFAVIFPPIPLFWMTKEIIRQHRLLNQLDD